MAAALQHDIELRRGATFVLHVRWETTPWLYAAIASISLTAPVTITSAAHAIPDGWKVAVVDAKGLTQLNAKNNPPKASDMRRATVVSATQIQFNEISATAGVRVACAASGSVNVESVATGMLVVTGGGNAAVEVGSSAHGAVAVRAEAGATINVSSNAAVRVGLRDFMLDVSVTTMLREISARTEPLSVVAMTAQRQVNATTKKQEVAVTA